MLRQCLTLLVLLVATDTTTLALSVAENTETATLPPQVYTALAYDARLVITAITWYDNGR